MSCQDCDDWQNSDKTTYYRWKNANVEMRGCNKHLVEIFDALSVVQKAREKSITPCPHCYCMTKTINGNCGKCKKEKYD